MFRHPLRTASVLALIKTIAGHSGTATLGGPKMRARSEGPQVSRRQLIRRDSRAMVQDRMKTPQQKTLSRMTNWQRNQWGRAGHPMDMDSINHYASLPHHSLTEVAHG